MPEAEQVLLSFGPFGVSVCDGRYGVFKWQARNITIVQLTGACIRGTFSRRLGFLTPPSIGRRGAFEITYASIVSVEIRPHPARLGLMQVLDVTYRDGGELRVKSIASFNGTIQNAYAILQRFAPRQEPPGGGPPAR